MLRVSSSGCRLPPGWIDSEASHGYYEVRRDPASQRLRARVQVLLPPAGLMDYGKG